MKKAASPTTGAKITPVVQLLAGASGFLLAALIGWKLAGGDQSSTPVGATASRTEKVQRDARPNRPTRGPTGPAAVQLQAIRTARNPDERMRAIVDLATQLPPSEFAAWMDGGWFNIRGGEGLTLFTKILQERWRQEDPEGLLLWSLKNKKDASGLLGSLAEQDPARVIQFFRENPDQNREVQLLSRMAAKQPALVLQRLIELSAENGFKQDTGYLGMSLRELAKRSPGELEAALASMSGAMKTSAETALIAERIKTSYETELQKLLERPDGARIYDNIAGNLSEEQRGRIFDRLGKLPPEWRTAMANNPYYYIDGKTAMKWFEADLEGQGFSTADALQMRSQAINQVAEKDPAKALALVDSLGLGPEERSRMIRNVFQNINDPKLDKDALIAGLGNEADKQTARALLEGRKESENVRKAETPEEWIAAVSATDLASGSGFYRYTTMLREWDTAKVDSLVGQFKAMPDEAKRKLALAVSRHSYSDTPGSLESESIRYLVANPETPAANPGDDSSNNGSGRDVATQMASRYVGKMATSDPEGAAEWIQSLPEGDAKLYARKNLHTLWSNFDPKAADQWKNSLSAKDRDAMNAAKN